MRENHSMTFLMDKRFLWRTIVVSLLMIDIFLLATGNPSITYSFLGGLLIAPLLMIIMVAIMGSYGYEALGGRANKWHFVLHVLFIAALVFGLSKARPYAERRASARIQAEVDAFVRNPMTSTADVSSEDRQLMLTISRQNFTMQRDTFIPTFRRASFLFRIDQAKTY